jgi:hypothetical protein
MQSTHKRVKPASRQGTRQNKPTLSDPALSRDTQPAKRKAYTDWHQRATICAHCTAGRDTPSGPHERPVVGIDAQTHSTPMPPNLSLSLWRHVQPGRSQRVCTQA